MIGDNEDTLIRLKKNSFLIRAEYVLVSILFVMMYSFSFHATWLLYDFFAIYSLIFFIKNTNFTLSIVTFSAFLFFTSLAVSSGAHFISFLSVWDTLKHLFIFFILFTLMKRHYSSKRIVRLLNILGPILILSLFIQFSLTMIQYFLGFNIDDMSGTFGKGASHSIGYFCLLVISYFLYIKRNPFLLFSIITLSCIINFLGDNLGFYILLCLMLLYQWVSFRHLFLFFFYLVTLILLAFLLDYFSGDFFLILQGRFSELLVIINPSNFNTSEITASRGFLTLYSFFNGGLFGAGPGAYSEIYFLKGWLKDASYNGSDGLLQLDISTAVNLLSETGIIGLLVLILTYITYIFYLFNTYSSRLFVSFFFILCVFYNSLATVETCMLMFLFILVFLKSQLLNIERNNKKFDKKIL